MPACRRGPSVTGYALGGFRLLEERAAVERELEDRELDDLAADDLLGERELLAVARELELLRRGADAELRLLLDDAEERAAGADERDRCAVALDLEAAEGRLEGRDPAAAERELLERLVADRAAGRFDPRLEEADAAGGRRVLAPEEADEERCGGGVDRRVVLELELRRGGGEDARVRGGGVLRRVLEEGDELRVLLRPLEEPAVEGRRAGGVLVRARDEPEDPLDGRAVGGRRVGVALRLRVLDPLDPEVAVGGRRVGVDERVDDPRLPAPSITRRAGEDERVELPVPLRGTAPRLLVVPRLREVPEAVGPSVRRTAPRLDGVALESRDRAAVPLGTEDERPAVGVELRRTTLPSRPASRERVDTAPREDEPGTLASSRIVVATRPERFTLAAAPLRRSLATTKVSRTSGVRSPRDTRPVTSGRSRLRLSLRHPRSRAALTRAGRFQSSRPSPRVDVAMIPRSRRTPRSYRWRPRS